MNTEEEWKEQAEEEEQVAVPSYRAPLKLSTRSRRAVIAARVPRANRSPARSRKRGKKRKV